MEIFYRGMRYLPRVTVFGNDDEKALVNNILHLLFEIVKDEQPHSFVRAEDEHVEVIRRVFRFDGQNWLFAFFKSYESQTAKERIAVILAHLHSTRKLPQKFESILPVLLDLKNEDNSISQLEESKL
ncbi:hypothetical protein FACS189472_12540 [Alphaproteobacteria bacterium]|nr:hypothetical protein FACS189472_12540 [Alphaproteobacteria bacterium]